MSSTSTNRVSMVLRHLSPTTAKAIDAITYSTTSSTPSTTNNTNSNSNSTPSSSSSSCSPDDQIKCGCSTSSTIPTHLTTNTTTSSTSTTSNEPKLSLRQKSKLAGMNGNMWHAIELEENLEVGKVVEAVWWKTSIALWKTEDGTINAIENRCAHRQLRLTAGHVEGDNLACCYHGWEYNGDGKVVKMAHEIPKSFKTMPNVRVRSYPTKVKYGIVFFFPGDPELAESKPLVTIPWLDEEVPMPFKFVDIEVPTHYLNCIENNCDFFHAYLHRKYKPFWWPELQYVQREGDAVKVNYKTDMGSSVLAQYFTSGQQSMNDMTLWYDYPVQRSNLIDKFLHWMFPIPIDETRTRTIYIFLWGPLKFAGIPLPYAIRPLLYWAVHKFYLTPVLMQDRWALEEEQKMHEQHHDKNSVELNPLVSAFQKLTVEQWEEYQRTEKERMERIGKGKWKLEHGAGLSQFDWAKYK